MWWNRWVVGMLDVRMTRNRSCHSHHNANGQRKQDRTQLRLPNGGHRLVRYI